MCCGKALVSQRVADSNAWYDSDHRSPAHLMAAVSHSSVGHSASVLETADLMKELPSAEAAFRRGALSEIQAIEVVSAASLAPEFEGDLLSSAECDALEEFRRKCARARASAGSEAERHARVHKNLSCGTGPTLRERLGWMPALLLKPERW